MSAFDDILRGAMKGWELAGEGSPEFADESRLAKTAAAISYLPSFFARAIYDPLRKGADLMERARTGQTYSIDETVSNMADFIGGGMLSSTLTRAEGSAIANIGRSEAAKNLFKGMLSRHSSSAERSAARGLAETLRAIPQTELDRVSDVYWDYGLSPKIRGVFSGRDKTIRMNPDDFTRADLGEVLAHEVVHARQFFPELNDTEIGGAIKALALSTRDIDYTQRPIEAQAKYLGQVIQDIASQKSLERDMLPIDDSLYSDLFNSTLGESLDERMRLIDRYDRKKYKENLDIVRKNMSKVNPDSLTETGLLQLFD